MGGQFNRRRAVAKPSDDPPDVTAPDYRQSALHLDFSRASDILEFVHRWYPYGGGSDYDIYVRFGLAPGQFFRRAASLLHDYRGTCYPPGTIDAMRLVCQVRLTGSDQSSRKSE